MTKREAAIITAFTGKFIGDFSTFHAYVEELLGRPVWTHEFANSEVSEKNKRVVKERFCSVGGDLVALKEYKCEQCGFSQERIEFEPRLAPWCPHCKAPMRLQISAQAKTPGKWRV